MNRAAVYLATRDVRHLAIRTGHAGTPYPTVDHSWFALCGRAGSDAAWMVVRPGHAAEGPLRAALAARAARPVCKRCTAAMERLTAAAALAPLPPPAPLPTIS